MRESEARDSALHRLGTGTKLVGILALIVTTALMPRRAHWLYLAPASVLLILWPISRMPVWFALKRLLFAEVFILGIAVLSLLNPASLPVFVSALIKSNLCVLSMLILAWTTPFHEILAQLRRLRFPTVMVTTIALLNRYLPVLVEESRRMQRARASRSFTRRTGFQWRNLSGIAGQLFIRSADRAERIYLAMCARGWK